MNMFIKYNYFVVYKYTYIYMIIITKCIRLTLIGMKVEGRAVEC